MNLEIPPLEVRNPRGLIGPEVSSSCACQFSAGAPAAQVGGSGIGRYTMPATALPSASEKPMQILHCSPKSICTSTMPLILQKDITRVHLLVENSLVPSMGSMNTERWECACASI